MRDLVIFPDIGLRRICAPVERVDSKLAKLLNEMLEVMYAAPGIGLSAPQIGVAKRALVVDVAKEGQPKQPLCVVNPKILWRSEEKVTYEEGCLSLPEQYAEVARPESIRLRFDDETGSAREIDAKGLLATCLQHEIDHLDGVLFIDHISKVRRDILVRKLAKARKAKASA
jgi:peptide deformylase